MFDFLHDALSVLCEDLPADRRCRADPRAHRAPRLPVRLGPLPHRARAGAGEPRGSPAWARGSARGAAAVGLPRPQGCGPGAGARRLAGADAGS